MSIDHKTETLIPFHEARSAFPGGRKLALQTLHRWASPRGVRGVRLETILIGGMRYTSREAICRFIACQNIGESASTPTINKSQRARQAKAANHAAALKLV